MLEKKKSTTNLFIYILAIKYKTKLSLNDSISIENECTRLDTLFANYYKNMMHDSIFVIITENHSGWEDSYRFLIKKRKLLKTTKRRKNDLQL